LRTKYIVQISPQSDVLLITHKLINSMRCLQEVDHVFDGVPVRIYEPVRRTGVLPGFVWYHGGGWVVGTLSNEYFVPVKLYS